MGGSATPWNQKDSDAGVGLGLPKGSRRNSEIDDSGSGAEFCNSLHSALNGEMRPHWTQPAVELDIRGLINEEYTV